MVFNVDFRFAPNDVIEAVTGEICDGPIEGVAAIPAPNCILLSFHESYARYAVRYWLSNLAADDATDSILRTRVYFVLKRARIPFSIPAHALFLTEESKEREASKAGEERQRRMEALGRVEFFDELAEEDRARLAAGLREAPFTRGEVMTRQGDEAHWLYLVLAGEALVTVRGEGGPSLRSGPRRSSPAEPWASKPPGTSSTKKPNATTWSPSRRTCSAGFAGFSASAMTWVRLALR